jgi:hypothetical protein
MDYDTIVYKLQKYQNKLENGTGDKLMYNAKVQFYQKYMLEGGLFPWNRKIKVAPIAQGKNFNKCFEPNAGTIIDIDTSINTLTEDAKRQITESINNHTNKQNIENTLRELKKTLQLINDAHMRYIGCYKLSSKRDIITSNNLEIEKKRDFINLNKHKFNQIECIFKQIILGVNIKNPIRKVIVIDILLNTIKSLIEYNIYEQNDENKTISFRTPDNTWYPKLEIIHGGGPLFKRKDDNDRDHNILTKIIDNIKKSRSDIPLPYGRLQIILNNTDRVLNLELKNDRKITKNPLYDRYNTNNTNGTYETIYNPTEKDLNAMRNFRSQFTPPPTYDVLPPKKLEGIPLPDELLPRELLPRPPHELLVKREESVYDTPKNTPHRRMPEEPAYATPKNTPHRRMPEEPAYATPKNTPRPPMPLPRSPRRPMPLPRPPRPPMPLPHEPVYAQIGPPEQLYSAIGPPKRPLPPTPTQP